MSSQRIMQDLEGTQVCENRTFPCPMCVPAQIRSEERHNVASSRIYQSRDAIRRVTYAFI